LSGFDKNSNLNSNWFDSNSIRFKIAFENEFEKAFQIKKIQEKYLPLSLLAERPG
jgi:hypothetical protein